MNRAFFSLICGAALLGGSFVQAADDDNEGVLFTKIGADRYRFTHKSKAGRYYFLQHSEDLVTWSYFPDLYAPGQGLPAVESYEFSVSEADRFFLRLKYLESYTGDPLETDYDGDKVNTYDELDSGTDPFHSADSDGDGMPDDWETRYGLLKDDPSDATADSDEDLVDNLTEYQNATDPTDHYNGSGYPNITVFNRPIYDPVDVPGTLISVVFEVKAGATPVNHALVTVSTEDGDRGLLSLTSDGAGLKTVLHLRTGADGRAQVYFKHPSAIVHEPTKRFIGAKVGSALVSGNGNRVLPFFSPETFVYYPYPPGTVGLHASQAIDSRINAIPSSGVANAKLVFSTQIHGTVQDPTPNYVRNTASWCYDLRQQMTCISPWNNQAFILGAGTAITAQHVVGAEHNHLYRNDTIRFITANNQVVERNVQGWALDPQNDLAVYTLNAPLPSTITPCRLLPANYANYLSYLEHARPPVIYLDQEEKAVVAELHQLGALTEFTRPGLYRKRLEFYELIISGDSGNPAFLIINNELVLLSTHTGQTYGTFLTPQIDHLNTMIAAANADATAHNPSNPITTGLPLQIVDLSGFSPYPPPPPP